MALLPVAARGSALPAPGVEGGAAGPMAGESVAELAVSPAGLGSVAGDRLASIDCLTAAIAYEAGNEPEAGKQAVAQVILNRVRHHAFPKSVCGVVYQGSGRRTGCQFTFTCDGSLRRRLAPRTLAAALQVATAAIEGRLPQTVGIATHYHADYVAPRWAPAMHRIGRIGAHIFYNFPNAGAGSARSMPGTIDMQGRSGRPAAAPFTVWGLVPAAPVAGTGDARK